MHFRDLTFYKYTLTFNFYYLVYSYRVEEQTVQLLQMRRF